MEDIEEFDNVGDLENQVISIDTKMGAEETRIKALIQHELTQFASEESNVESKIAGNLKEKLDEEFGSNWNVVVGRLFVTCLGLVEADRFGHFKGGRFNITVFETTEDVAEAN
jgi:hypothetical protein